jgi:hypothetical protein
MTRTNRRSQQVEFVIDDSPVCSIYLASTYYDLCKETNKDLECPVCMESVLCCKTCFTILKCGHSYHAGCYLRLDKCAVCRQ